MANDCFVYRVMRVIMNQSRVVSVSVIDRKLMWNFKDKKIDVINDGMK